ncbi:MAG: Sec-independent protein translocase protein TatB [Alphaproteobacteria bacterium]
MPTIGGLEMLIIAIVAIVVVGPRDLPKMLRDVGQFVGRLRGLSRDFTDSIQDMATDIELEDMRRSIESVRDPVNSIKRELEETLDPTSGQARETSKTAKPSAITAAPDGPDGGAPVPSPSATDPSAGEPLDDSLGVPEPGGDASQKTGPDDDAPSGQTCPSADAETASAPAHGAAQNTASSDDKTRVSAP